MSKRYLSIWFPQLLTDRVIRINPGLKDQPFVLAAPERGRMVIRAASAAAMAQGILPGMVVADCRAILPSLQVFDADPKMAGVLLEAFAAWCIRYTPVAGIDLPDGLILDVSGCAHLWGGEQAYLKDLSTRLTGFGYHILTAMADTIGTAWAAARFGKGNPIIEPGGQLDALLPLSPAALRLDPALVQRLEKLGLYQVKSFIHMPRRALRRRFGDLILSRLDQALGQEIETITPFKPVAVYQERLPSLEPIRTARGIEIALLRLLETLCQRMAQEEIGLRSCIFRCYRIDGQVQQLQIGTNRPSRNPGHLFQLFETRIGSLEPDLGFELFLLEAPVVEDIATLQDQLFNAEDAQDTALVAELLDRIAGKVGVQAIRRYLPAEHHWPERSIREASSLDEASTITWQQTLPRPLHLLAMPEQIQVMVPLPDYPPVQFHYKGRLHRIRKADGPERIEQEWWIEASQPRDYYCVEDELGARYWIFRLGLYQNGEPQWYLHGFFA